MFHQDLWRSPGCLGELVATINYHESWGKVLRKYLESGSVNDYVFFDCNYRRIPIPAGSTFIPKKEDFPIRVFTKAGRLAAILWSALSRMQSFPKP